MERISRFDKKGLSLIELMVGLVICAIALAGIYRLFVAQGKAYVVQDQVAEVQQNVRSAMEIMLRDLRMTGFDDDRTPLVTNSEPVVVPGDSSITVKYEYEGAPYEVYYWLDGSLLKRQETKNGVATTETILENVSALTFFYGMDENNDNAMDDRNVIGNHDDDWATAAEVGTSKVISVRVSLTAKPTEVNPDLKSLTARTLVSAVTFRNLSLMR